MFGSKNPKKTNYFLKLYELTDYCVRTAKFLDDTINHSNLQDIKNRIDDAHEIEHSADIAQHKLIAKLSKEFLTPIEREDIVLLAQSIDDVTDSVESVFLHLYMYNVDNVTPEVYEFSRLIYESCTTLRELMNEFQKFRKSENINNLIIKLNDLESEGDTLYTESVHSLFAEEHDPVYRMKWTNILSHLEKCLDSCEYVACVVKRVIMANS